MSLMPIVCGTDFSPPAADTATLGAQLAQRLGRPLSLVHVLDTRGVMFNQGAVLEALQLSAEQRLSDEVARLQACGATVRAQVYEGWPDEGLLRGAEQYNAGLILMSALGARGPGRGNLGRTAERVAGRTRAPLLVVRDAAPLRQWLNGERTLKILCGFNTSAASAVALEWLGHLREFGPCELIAVNIHDPEQEAQRLGIQTNSAAPPAATEQVQHVIAHSLRSRLQRVFGRDTIRLIVAPFKGSPATRLAELAIEEGADLVVIGSHQRRRLDRARHGSMSITLMRHSQASVLMVPGAIADRVQVPAPAMATVPTRQVLVATDLSTLGNHAVGFAFKMAPPGSRLRLMTAIHPRRMPAAQALVQQAAQTAVAGVNKPVDAEVDMAARYQAWRAQCHRQLLALVPADHLARGLAVEVEVVEAEDAAEAIRENAERMGADLVCMGTAWRSGVSAALLGTVDQEVLRRLQRPVLLVPEPARRSEPGAAANP